MSRSSGAATDVLRIGSREVKVPRRLAAQLQTLRDRRLDQIAAAMVLLQLILRALTVPKSYYWGDDFTHLTTFREQPLGWGSVVRDYNDHLEMLTNLVYWVLAQHPTESYLVPAAIVVTLQALVAVLMWLVLRELFGEQPVLLVPFAVFLFTPLGLVNVMWFAAALQGLPLQLAMLGLLLGTLRWQRLPAWSWFAVATVSHVYGLLTWEKALVALPMALAVHVLIAWRGQGVRGIGQRLWRGRWLWLAQVAVWIPYLVLYLGVTDGSERADAENDGVGVGDAVQGILLKTLLPGLVGAPWQPRGAENTLYPWVSDRQEVLVVLGLGLVVAASFWRLGRRAVAPWVLLGGYVAGDVALLVWGRFGYFGITARDPRYVFDALVVICLCLAAAFTVVREEPAPRRRIRDLTLPNAYAVAVTVGASCLLLTIPLSPVVERTFSREYVEGMTTWLDSHPDRSVVNTPTPVTVSFVSVRELANSVGRDAPFDQPASTLYMFDDLAQMRPVTIPQPLVQQEGPEAGCGWAVGSRPTPVVDLPGRSGYRGPTVLQIEYTTDQQTTLRVRVGDQDRQQIDVFPGAGQAWFVVADPVGELSVEATDSNLCVTRVTVGQPWPA